MKNTSQNNQAFSILIAIFLVGFLLVLTTGVFNLVLREMKNNKGSESYLKAYAGAEGAMELGLLGIKEKGYGYDKDITKTDSGSEVLSFNTNFQKSSDPQISYTMDIQTQSFSGSITSGKTIIIPLFWKSDTDIGTTTNPKLEVTSSNEEHLVWNIIGEQAGISGTGGITAGKTYTYIGVGGNSESKTITKFLSDNTASYLMLYNKDITNTIEYKLQALDKSGVKEYFSKPSGTITSSVTVGKYRQNISTTIDNTEFLKMLKYSIYNN